MTAAQFRSELDALGAEYRNRLPGKLAEIDGLWRDLMNGALPPAALTDLRRELHTLAGSARTFGVSHVSELAAAAEMVIEPFWEKHSLPDPAGAAELTRLLDALNRPAGGG